ncbi:MAG: hypothetical protein WKF63_11380 [Thermomicrobiales bacterium]
MSHPNRLARHLPRSCLLLGLLSANPEPRTTGCAEAAAHRVRSCVPVAVRDFVTGWEGENGERWGRPASVVAAPDGNLIVSDDDNVLLYRISPET